MSNMLAKILEEGRKNIKVDPNRIDKKCPFTGGLKLRGKTFTGIVVTKDTHKSVTVAWSSQHFVKKYERFMVKRTKVTAHNPEVINAEVGDQVIIAECKPLSKTKNFVVVKNLGHSKEYAIKQESIMDDKKVGELKKTSKKSDDKKSINNEIENESN